MWQIRSARSVADAEALRATWQAMGFTEAETDLDRFLAAVREDGAVRPHVLVAEHAGEPRAMLLSRLEHRDVQARFGYATLHSARLNCLTVPHGGGAGPGRAEAEPRLVAALLGELDSREADSVLFRYVDVDSALFRDACRMAGVMRRPYWLAVEPHWTCELPGSYDEFLARMPRRKSALRYARKLEREFGERLEVRRYTSVEDLERVLDDLESVAGRSYQRGLGVGFDAARHGGLVRLDMERGWFDAWILYVDSVPRAFEMGTTYQGTYFLAAKGYDPEWASQRVGNYVALRAWRDLCEDAAVRHVDFGYGDADYKREAATAHRREADLMIHARSPRGIVTNALHSSVTGADRMVRRLAGKDRVARVKRRWRDLRTPGARPAAPKTRGR
jgi:Acetyltransferase (GNAT) domain